MTGLNKVSKRLVKRSKNQLQTRVICSICLESGTIGQVYSRESTKLNYMFVLNNCSHYFHYNCIGKWLKNSRTCPMCRTSVPEKHTLNHLST